MITNLFPPHFVGGYELSCQEVTDYLFEQGEDMFVLCGEYKSDESSSAPYPVSRKLKYIDYLSDDYWQKSRVEKHNYKITMQTLDKFKPDFVYFFNQQYISLAPHWAVNKKELPYVFDIGDLWPFKYHRSDFRGKLKSFVKRILPNFLEAKMVIDPVIILSEWMKPLLEENFDSEQIYTIPRGVKVKEITRTYSNSGPIKFIFTSRLDPAKGLHLIVGVLSNLKEYDWILDVYGSGSKSYIVEIEKLIKNNSLEERVILHGKVYPLDQEYENHDVCLFPTLGNEGFGRVAIEALSFGLPVLTVNKYGPNDVIHHGYNGFKCSTDDLYCWRKYLIKLLTNRELLAEMSRNALTTIKEKYDINVTNKKRYDIIKEIYNSK